MRRPPAPGSTIVVKIGSSSLTGGGVGLDDSAVDRVCAQIAALRVAGHPTVLVTSAAVAAGLPALGLSERPGDLPGLQVAAAVGQSRLMERYTNAFAERGLIPGQVLLTKAVLADREQYLHARNALGRMLDLGLVPVVNENDTVAVEELRLGDNDRLAALVSHLVTADMLLLLTDTAGLLTADPRTDETATLLSAVRHTDRTLDEVSVGGGGPLGSGGPASKIAAARMAAWSGVPTIIAPADAPDVVDTVLSGREIGTWVDPEPSRLPARKLWIAFGQPAMGTLSIDAGAADALVGSGTSLLPVGLTSVAGSFGPGAAVEVLDPEGRLVAKGVVRLSSEELEAVRGRRSTGATVEAIHRDDLVVLVDQASRRR